MAKLYGHRPSAVVPQDDFSADQNENGGWKCTQTFRIRKGDIDNFDVKSKFPIGATLKSLDFNCDDFFQYLRLSTIKAVQNIPGGWQAITVEFTGFGGGGSAEFDPPEVESRPTFSKRGVLVDAPLNEHPYWKKRDDKERNSLGKLLSGEWLYIEDPFTTGKYVIAVATGEGQYSIRPEEDQLVNVVSQLFAERIAEGITTYKHATYEYHHRWQSNKGVTAAQMNGLGKIDNPAGSPPTPGAGRNWLLVGVNEEQSGNSLFNNELVYLLSDDGGHDVFLYGGGE